MSVPASDVGRMRALLFAGAIAVLGLMAAEALAEAPLSFWLFASLNVVALTLAVGLWQCVRQEESGHVRPLAWSLPGWGVCKAGASYWALPLWKPALVADGPNLIGGQLLVIGGLATLMLCGFSLLYASALSLTGGLVSRVASQVRGAIGRARC